MSPIARPFSSFPPLLFLPGLRGQAVRLMLFVMFSPTTWLSSSLVHPLLRDFCQPRFRFTPALSSASCTPMWIFIGPRWMVRLTVRTVPGRQRHSWHPRTFRHEPDRAVSALPVQWSTIWCRSRPDLRNTARFSLPFHSPASFTTPVGGGRVSYSRTLLLQLPLVHHRCAPPP